MEYYVITDTFLLFQGLSVGLHHLIEVGESLCEAVEEFYNPPVASVSEYSLTSPVGPGGDPSKVNLCNPEDPRYRCKGTFACFVAYYSVNLRALCICNRLLCYDVSFSLVKFSDQKEVTLCNSRM